MPHTVGKLLTRAKTSFKNSPQSKVFKQSYGPPKLWESQFWEFQDSHLGVPGQNDIWVLALWPDTTNTIRGKVVASFKFKPWWVLWVCVCRGSSMHQKCSNYALTNLLFGLCRSMWVIEVFVTLHSLHFGTLARPSTPKMGWVKEHGPTPYPFVVFTFDSQLSLLTNLGCLKYYLSTDI